MLKYLRSEIGPYDLAVSQLNPRRVYAHIRRGRATFPQKNTSPQRGDRQDVIACLARFYRLGFFASLMDLARDPI